MWSTFWDSVLEALQFRNFLNFVSEYHLLHSLEASAKWRCVCLSVSLLPASWYRVFISSVLLLSDYFSTAQSVGAFRFLQVWWIHVEPVDWDLLFCCQNSIQFCFTSSWFHKNKVLLLYWGFPWSLYLYWNTAIVSINHFFSFSVDRGIVILLLQKLFLYLKIFISWKSEGHTPEGMDKKREEGREIGFCLLVHSTNSYNGGWSWEPGAQIGSLPMSAGIQPVEVSPDSSQDRHY